MTKTNKKLKIELVIARFDFEKAFEITRALAQSDAIPFVNINAMKDIALELLKVVASSRSRHSIETKGCLVATRINDIFTLDYILVSSHSIIQ